MGNHDRRCSMKMKRRKAQVKKKARAKKQAAEKAAANTKPTKSRREKA